LDIIRWGLLILDDGEEVGLYGYWLLVGEVNQSNNLGVNVFPKRALL